MEKLDRTKFIGASEIGAIMGMSPFTTPLQVWAEKTGKVPHDELSNFEAKEWGTRLEEVVAEKFSQKNGLKLMAYKTRFVHPEYDYISCELDRIIVGTDELVEVKTCNAWAAKQWAGDEIPNHYVLQVNLQLGLSKRKKGHLAVLIGGSKYIEKAIEFNQKLYDQEIEAAKDFWERFILGTEIPLAMADDNTFLSELYPEAQEGTKFFVEQDAIELNMWVEERQGGKTSIKEAEVEVKAIEAKIKQKLGESEYGETDQYKISWRSVNKKEFIVKASSYRMLRTTQKKGRDV